MLIVSGKRYRQLQEDYESFRSKSDELIHDLTLQVADLEGLLDLAQRQLDNLPRRGPRGRFQPRP